MDVPLSAAAREPHRQPVDSDRVSLGRRILRHLGKWPATAAEMVEALHATHDDVHAAIAALEADDVIVMYGKRQSNLRVWALRDEVPA